jgi:hypothetical protein
MRWRGKPPFGTSTDPTHPLAHGMTLALAMNEGQGVWWSDSTGRADGPYTTVGTIPTWVSTSNGWSNFFITGGINCGTSLRWRPTNGCTYATRVQPFATNTTRTFIRADDGSTNRIALLDINSAVFRMNSIGGTIVSASAATTPIANTWYDVAGTVDVPNNVNKIYINGKLDGTSSGGTVAFAGTGNPPMSVGQQAGGNQFQGYMAFAFAWNRALSADEIAAFTSNPWDLFRPAPGWTDPQEYAYYYVPSGFRFRRTQGGRAGSRGPCIYG